MRALVLAAGRGTRLRPLTDTIPKCLIPLSGGQTILSRQLDLLETAGIAEAVVVTGARAHLVDRYIADRCGQIRTRTVFNPIFASTNYLYSMFLAAPGCDQDLLLLHGDLVFSGETLRRLMAAPHPSAVAVRLGHRTGRDFEGRLAGGRVVHIGVGLEGPNCHFLAPLYRLSRETARAWFGMIGRYVAQGNLTCYAEDALNELLPGSVDLRSVDIGHSTCCEVDTHQDLALLETVSATDQAEAKGMMQELLARTQEGRGLAPAFLRDLLFSRRQAPSGILRVTFPSPASGLGVRRCGAENPAAGTARSAS